MPDKSPKEIYDDATKAANAAFNTVAAPYLKEMERRKEEAAVAWRREKKDALAKYEGAKAAALRAYHLATKDEAEKRDAKIAAAWTLWQAKERGV